MNNFFTSFFHFLYFFLFSLSFHLLIFHLFILLLLICFPPFLLQQAFSTDYNISIYSAHDYSILCVLGSLGIITALQQASLFGCFLIFELWDGIPPVHPSGSGFVNRDQNNNSTNTTNNSTRSNNYSDTDKIEKIEKMKSEKFKKQRGESTNNLYFERNDSESRILRILANFRPFSFPEIDSYGTLGKDVDENEENVLAEFDIEEVKMKHRFLFDTLVAKGMYIPTRN